MNRDTGKEKMKQVTINIPVDLYDHIKSAAFRADRDFAQQVRHILRQWIQTANIRELRP